MKSFEFCIHIFIFYSLITVSAQSLSARTRLIFGTVFTMSADNFEWNERNVIHVTGFGPFRGFTDKNPSWEAVSRLPDHIEHNDMKLTVKKHNVAVTYDAVDEIVPKLWQTKPLLVVHCGVNHNAKSIHLERNAFNGNFCQADWDGKHLEQTGLCLPNSGECQHLCTKLDLDSIVSTCKDKPLECSHDPGNYLCGYIYLKSLDFDSNRCLFIHVPPISEHHTVETIGEAILIVIKKCIEQLKTDCGCPTK